MRLFIANTTTEKGVYSPGLYFLCDEVVYSIDGGFPNVFVSFMYNNITIISKGTEL